MNCNAATRIVRRLAKRAGISKEVSPHPLRHGFITAAWTPECPYVTHRWRLVTPIRESPGAVNRGRSNPDCHAAYIVTAFMASTK